MLAEFFDVHTLIWTLINFVLFVLVLKFLLLDPLLKVMDARKEKISQYDAKRKSIADAAEKRRAELEEERAAKLIKAKEDAEAAYEAACERAKSESENDIKANADELKKAEEDISREKDDILSKFELAIPAMTSAFLGKTLKKDTDNAD